MAALTYDAGVLIAAEGLGDRVWQLHIRALEAGNTPTAPAGVLAQVWQGGGRQANLTRFLRPCEIDALDERQARVIGAALAITARWSSGRRGAARRRSRATVPSCATWLRHSGSTCGSSRSELRQRRRLTA